MCKSTDGSGLAGFKSQEVRVKEKLCREQLGVMSIIDPGLSVSRGQLLYELQKCQLHLGRFLHLSM